MKDRNQDNRTFGRGPFSRISNRILRGLEDEKWLGTFIVVTSVFALTAVVMT